MSSIKERILGAVTIMSEKDADALWNIIIDRFSEWANVKEIEPDETDLAMLKEIETNPDCGTFISNEAAMKELELN